MSLPFYSPQDDPGPDFAALLRRTSDVAQLQVPWDGSQPSVPHGTTCVAIRYEGGVVMAGDRRATAGNFISHRTIEKVFPADRHSGVAIAGAAGPAMEMVHLFQLQLEHYEKVEGEPVSLEGKANQLSQMVRNHLPAAMTGFGVVPIFAGYDPARASGRIFQYDLTGGRYEEHDHAANGSGSMHATTVVKLAWRRDLSDGDAIDLALRALLEAADEDSATGGVDLVRGIYPVVATIDASGFNRIDDDVLAQRYEQLLDGLAEREGEAQS